MRVSRVGCHKASILFLLLVLLLVRCGQGPAPFECTDAIGCVEIAAAEPIRIGVLQALSGDMAAQGHEHLQCVALAIADRDETLLDHRLVLETADSQCSAEGGTTAALKIAADRRILGIVGPTCSGAAATAMQVVSDAGLVMISSSSSSPALTAVGGARGPDWEPGFFRTAQNDSLSGRAAASFAFEVLGVVQAATIDDGGSYSKGLTDTFNEAFTRLGGEVVLSATVNKGDTDMRPVLTAVAMSGAELLFFVVYRPEGDHIVLQARELQGLENVILLTAEGLYFEPFLQAVGEAGTGLYFNAPDAPEGPSVDAFLARHEAKYGALPATTPYSTHTYDAANLLLRAIESVAIQDEDGVLHIGRQALRDALYATSGYQGLTGSLTCDEYGDCAATRIQVRRLDDLSAGFEGLAANVVYTYPPGE